jgi:Flp pilus assembly protein TadG
MWGRSRRPLKSLLKRFLKSPDGATAVEFALVGGPFFFVLGCIAETGLMLFSEYVIQNSVQEASRNIRTGQVTTTDGTLKITADEFKALVCQDVSIIIDCDADVTVYVNSSSTFSGLKALAPDPITIGVKDDGSKDPVTFTPGGQLKPVTVIATYDWDFTFPFMDFLGNVSGGSKRRLYGLAIFRNEPF